MGRVGFASGTPGIGSAARHLKSPLAHPAIMIAPSKSRTTDHFAQQTAGDKR